MTRTFFFRLRRDTRGAALLEMALTLPMMLLVAAGIFEFGRAYQTWQIITNAAREGARIAVLPGTTDTMVSDRVKTYMSDGQLSDSAAATVAIQRDATIAMGAGTATASKITVNYPFTFVVLQPISKLINPSSTLGAPLTMSVSALMRNET
ncbi:MAG TPA: TadE family protein [Vicinamibacterales bacterium]|jgi:Flp pilus assembly protein TadG|nr:TadE family protein [Vicinamibacterales bacterium]